MKNKRIMMLAALFVIICIVIIFGIYKSGSKNHIKSGVTINDKDFSELTYDKAKKTSEELEKEILSHKVVIQDGKNEYFATFTNAGISTNMQEVLQNAYDYRRTNTLVKSVMSMFVEDDRNFYTRLLLDEDKFNLYIKRLKKDIDKDPVEAKILRFTNKKTLISDSSDGVKLDIAKLRDEMYQKIYEYKSGDIILQATVEKIRPKISKEALKTIDSMISSYSTYYSEGVVGRAKNIKKAVAAVNGTLVMPNSEFSFNSITGERTINKGYAEAPIIVNNKLQPGPAGGVCQVSSTLYNAVIRANIRSVERRNHSLAPAYIPLGFDATVSECIDYRFRNTLKYPIYIRGNAQNGKVTFSVYANKYYTQKKYKLVNKVIKVIEPKIIYNKVGTLPKGKKEIAQQKHKGYKVKVYLVTIGKGKEEARVLISEDEYIKTDEIINIGV